MIHFGHESLGAPCGDTFGIKVGCIPTSRRRRGCLPGILWEIRRVVRAILKDLGPSFGKLYTSEGRPSIPPEQLLSALLLQAFYSIRSERQLMEELDYHLLYHWFVGVIPDV